MMPSQREPINIQCFTDNRSLKDSIYSTKTLQDKHLIIDMAIIKEMITTKEIESVSWIESQLQLADCMTKIGASATEKSRCEVVSCIHNKIHVELVVLKNKSFYWKYDTALNYRIIFQFSFTKRSFYHTQLANRR